MPHSISEVPSSTKVDRIQFPPTIPRLFPRWPGLTKASRRILVCRQTSIPESGCLRVSISVGWLLRPRIGLLTAVCFGTQLGFGSPDPSIGLIQAG